MYFRMTSIWACHLLPSPSSPSLAALRLEPSPLWGLGSFSWVSLGSGQFPLTCKQTWPPDLQLEVELIFHGVGHGGVQERRQAQLVAGAQGPGAEAMPVFSGEGVERRRRRWRAARANVVMGGQCEKTVSPWQSWHPCSPAQKGAQGSPPTPGPYSLSHSTCPQEGLGFQHRHTTYEGRARGQAWCSTVSVHVVLTRTPKIRQQGPPTLPHLLHLPHGETEAQQDKATSLSFHKQDLVKCACSPSLPGSCLAISHHFLNPCSVSGHWEPPLKPWFSRPLKGDNNDTVILSECLGKCLPLQVAQVTGSLSVSSPTLSVTLLPPHSPKVFDVWSSYTYIHGGFGCE